MCRREPDITRSQEADGMSRLYTHFYKRSESGETMGSVGEIRDFTGMDLSGSNFGREFFAPAVWKAAEKADIGRCGCYQKHRQAGKKL